MRYHLFLALVLISLHFTAMARGQEVAIPEHPAAESDGVVVSQEAQPAEQLAMADQEAGGESAPCDCKKLAALQKKVAGAHKPLFYDNDFSYLCDECYCDWYAGDHAKRMCLHDCLVLDVGGQYRTRYHHEHNHRGLGLTGVDDQFQLHRTRLYGNLEVGRYFRAYVEYIDAVSFFENNNPRPIEENRSDLLNAFGELLVWEDCCGSEMRTRVGRQELLYGAQRAVSPLDWANTRRTFQGYKGMYQGHGWNVDAFWTNTLNPDTRNFDDPNQDEEFMGVYATTKDCCDRTYDLFYLRLLDSENQGAIVQDFDFHTIGGRVKGSHGCYDYEAWGAYQFGENTDGSDHSAGAFTLGMGRTWDCHCWKPSVWVYYDWASGDGLGAGDGNGYHHLFPLAHKYLGFMDLFGRRNIESPNVLLTVQPHEKLKLLLWYYYFRLQNGNDTPYSVVMTPFNAGVAPTSSDLGHEIDLIANYTINARMSVLLGYSHFFAGDYYDNPALPTSADADFFYAQFQFDF